MKTLAGEFKKALQALTTTVVKAEVVVGEPDEAARAELRAAGHLQWKRVLELHAALVGEQSASGADTPLPHGGWFEKTVARAEAAFGPLPASS